MYEDFIKKYPRASKFLLETGFNLDEALCFTEKILREMEKKNEKEGK